MIHWIAVSLAMLPAIILGATFATDGPGANPIEEITHTTGEWALRLLLASLSITPLRRYFGLHKLAPLRRTLGLVAFAYAVTHFATWSILDMGLDSSSIFEDITERPYVMVGMGAFLLLLPLAVTSTRAWIRRLGRRWVKLHRFVYAAACLAVLHHFWLTKADYQPAIIHGAILAFLLGARLAWLARGRPKKA